MNTMPMTPTITPAATRPVRGRPATSDGAAFESVLGETLRRDAGQDPAGRSRVQGDATDEGTTESARTEVEDAATDASSPTVDEAASDTGTEPGTDAAATPGTTPQDTAAAGATTADGAMLAVAPEAVAASGVATGTTTTTTATEATLGDAGAKAVPAAPAGSAAQGAATTDGAEGAPGTTGSSTHATADGAATSTADTGGATSATADQADAPTTTAPTGQGAGEANADASGPDISNAPAGSGDTPGDGSEQPAAGRDRAAGTGDVATAAGSDGPDATPAVSRPDATLAEPGGRLDAANRQVTASGATTTEPGAATAERLLRMNELVDAARATMRHRGPERMVLELHPAELGTVTVDLRLDGQTVNVQLRASHAGAVERLAAELEQLRQDLANAGVSVGDLDVSSGSQGRSADRDGLPRTDGAGRRHTLPDPAATVAERRRPGVFHPSTNGRLAVDL
jgi:flagellar hook-length control protein FliK